MFDDRYINTTISSSGLDPLTFDLKKLSPQSHSSVQIIYIF